MLVDHVPHEVMVEERVAVHQNVAEGDDAPHVGDARRVLCIQPREMRTVVQRECYATTSSRSR